MDLLLPKPNSDYRPHTSLPYSKQKPTQIQNCWHEHSMCGFTQNRRLTIYEGAQMVSEDVLCF